jgi:dienelactone hydrolase
LHTAGAPFSISRLETKASPSEPTYRNQNITPFPNSLNDVEDAVKYILDRPGEYDPKRIAISGSSAGAKHGTRRSKRAVSE